MNESQDSELVPASKIPDHQQHYLASGVASGLPIERLVLATGLPEKRVRQFLDRPTAKFQQLVDTYRVRQQMGLVAFQMEVDQFWDEAVQVVRKTLEQEKDLRLRYDCAKDVLSVRQVRFPRDEKQTGPTIQQNIYADNRTQKAIVNSFTSLAEGFSQLKEQMTTIDMDRHTHVGAAVTVAPEPEPTKSNGKDGEQTPEAPSGE